MAGIKALRKIQLGLESTKGTAVAATALWRGTGTIQNTQETVFADEDVGYVSGVDRTYQPKLGAELVMDSVPVTFEQIGYILAAGVKDVVTGSADGAGSDKIYTYTYPTTAVNTTKAYTIEGGDDQAAQEMEYSYVREFSITGKSAEALMVSATWLGRQVTTGISFTGSISVPTVEDALFQKGKIYVDATSGTIGTTQKSNTLLAFEWKCNTGWIPVYAADGNLYFSFNKQTMPEITVDMTFEHDSTATSLITDWSAETARLFRVDFDGSNVATPGTTFSTKKIRFDFASKIESIAKLDEIDGNDVLKVTCRPRYNATGALFAEIKVVNELASLT